MDIDQKVKTILSFFELAERDPSYRQNIQELGQILLKTHPDDARVLTINGDIALSMNNTALGRKYFMRAVELDNSRYPIWNQLLILEAELDILDTLRIHSMQAVELFPNQPVCYYFLGYANSRLKNYSEAAQAYETGAQLALDNNLLKVQFYLGMADSYHELQEHDKSDNAFDLVLKIDSNNTLALNNYSYYLSLREENLEKALRMSKKSNDLEPNQATYLDTYAWILYKLQRYQEAKEIMEKAIENGGASSAVILEHMGDIFFKLENIEQALIYWKKAKEIGDASDLINKKIQDKLLYE